jgi:peptide/nickel transport system permease protein
MGYLSYILKKAGIYVSVLFVTMIILFVVFEPVEQSIINAGAIEYANEALQSILRTQKLSDQQIQQLRDQLIKSYMEGTGYSKPPYIQVWYVLWDLITFNLGYSYFLQAPSGSKLVSDIIMSRLPNTLLLFLTSSILSGLIGLWLGIIATKRSRGILDRSIPFFALVHNSLPTWWLGLIFIFVFAFYVRAFPSGGITSTPPPSSPLLLFIDVLYHMFLPLVVLLLINVGSIAYIVKNILNEVTQQDFVIVAKAKGLSERKIFYGHIFKTASPAILTQLILAIAASIGGAITTEIVFNWPGMGLLYFEAIEQQDVPVIIGETFILTLVLIAGLFLGEVLYGLLDPRIRSGK